MTNSKLNEEEQMEFDLSFHDEDLWMSEVYDDLYECILEEEDIEELREMVRALNDASFTKEESETVIHKILEQVEDQS